MYNKALQLFEKTEKRDEWKYPKIYDVCYLVLQYLSLDDDLSSAGEASRIIGEIENIEW